MNFSTVIALIGILCVSYVATAPTSDELKKDFKEFKALLPKAKIAAIAAKHYVFDKHYRAAQKYIKSKEFATDFATVVNTPQFQNLANSMQEAGLNIIQEINSLTKHMGWPQFPETINSARSIIRRSVNSFVDEVIQALPKNKISALYQNKMQSSPAFKALQNKVTSEEYQKLYKEFQAAPQVSQFNAKLSSKGIEVSKLIELVKNLLGF